MPEALVEACQIGDVDGADFTPRQRLAVRYAEAMHIVHDIDDAFLAQMLEVFTEAEFVELGMVIAQFIAMGQFVSMLRIPNPNLVPN